MIEYYKVVFEVIIGKGNRVSKDKIAKINQWKRALRTNETPNKYENYISYTSQPFVKTYMEKIKNYGFLRYFITDMRMSSRLFEMK